MEQTEVRQAVMPLYLFQVSAHSRPVALQRKPRYSNLAKRKGRGYFRDFTFKLEVYTEFLCRAWVAASDPQVAMKAHFLQASLILHLFPRSSDVKR